MNNMCSEYLSKLITLKNMLVNLRSENNLIIAKYIKAAFGKNNFNYNGPFCWNALLYDEQKANVLYSFKSHIPE